MNVEKKDRMRLDKLLSHLGHGSRSTVHMMIQAGHVCVDGNIIRDAGYVIDVSQANVSLDGVSLHYQHHLWVMMHKPAGVITAAEDIRHQTVMDLMPQSYRAAGCMPVGRLDRDTEGLLLLTNDGTAAHRILSPKQRVDKVYLAHVDGQMSMQDVAAFAKGIPFKDFCALPAKLELLAPQCAHVTVQEGKYHQVKRMFQACGRTVTYLKRLSIGPIVLDESLAPGDFRALTAEEKTALLAACEGEKNA